MANERTSNKEMFALFARNTTNIVRVCSLFAEMFVFRGRVTGGGCVHRRIAKERLRPARHVRQFCASFGGQLSDRLFPIFCPGFIPLFDRTKASPAEAPPRNALHHTTKDIEGELIFGL